MSTHNPVFYRQWILANGLSEAAGLGTTFLIGRALAPQLESVTETAAILGVATLAVVFGTAFEGILVGGAQELVLRQRGSQLRPWSWTFATAAGAGLAWLVGMVPNTIVALSHAGSPPASASEPALVVRLALALGLGLIAGPILGVVQWIVLRRLIVQSGHWLWANALAWGAGMPVIFAGMDIVPWTASPLLVILSVYAVSGVAGAIAGAIHGRVLVQLVTTTMRTN